MNSTPRDGQAPSHRQCLLPSVAHTSAVAEVTPAKKITFLKRGDPQFAGVRLAVHQRAFKTFSALMDELSERMPLSFGVRSVTTPRGLHGLSALEQLQDGGCYLCSDKKPPKTPGGPGGPQGRSPSALQLRDFEAGHEVPGTSSSWKGPTAPRKMTLVKNGDPRSQQTVVLSHRNTRSLTAFLSKASDLLRFPVKQVYTLSGTKVDSLQALLRSPSTLVCAGNEAFRPLAMENTGRNETGSLSGLTSRSKSGCWGPKAKPSVIHSRSGPSSRPQQFSLPSDRSGLGDLQAPGPRAWVGPAPDRCPPDTPAPPGPVVASDDVEKKVHMNADGSLSVEMKVRFRLLGKEALLWSQRVRRASVLTAASGDGPGLGEAAPRCCGREGHAWGSLEPGVRGLGPCEAQCQGDFDGGQQPGPGYDIWRNPLFTPQGEGLAPRRRAGLAQLSCHRGRRSLEANGRKRRNKDSGSPASSARCLEGSESEGGVDSGNLCPASVAVSQSRAEQGAIKGTCLEGGGPGGWGQCGCWGPRTQGVERALSDSSASAESGEESSDGGVQHWGCPRQTRVVASQGKAMQGDSPAAPTVRPSSLNNVDLQAEKHGPGSGDRQAKGGTVKRLPLAPGHSASRDTEGSCPLPPTCAPTQHGRRKHRRPASAVCAPSTPGLRRGAQRGHARQRQHRRDSHSPRDSPVTLPWPRPPDGGRACPGGPEPRFSQNPSRTREQASGELRQPSPSSLDSQDRLGTSRATVTPGSNSDCASGFSHPSARSVEQVGDAKCGAHPAAPTPAHTCEAGDLGGEAGGTPRPSSPSVPPDGWPEGGGPGACRGCCCSQIIASPAPGTPSGQTQAPRGPFSEACRAGSSYCPTPPGQWPCTRSSSGHRRADDGAAPRRVSPEMSPGPRGGLEEKEEDSVTPSALPHTSPDSVVREWLGNLPEQPVLMRDEIAGDTTNVAGDGPEGPEEDPGDDRSLKGLKELARVRQQPQEDADEHPEPAGALAGPDDADPKSGGGPHPDAAPGRASKAPAEAGAGEGVTVGHGVSTCVLPSSVSTSTQIMKALLGSKQGRPSSLPEVSGPVARRLSRSAGALITCLASLHFFDEALGSQASKGKLADSPRYQELMSISQALWPGCGLGRDQLDSGLGVLPSHQAQAGTEDLTPTSSSGVDVSSGSGGSGEGSGPCAMDVPLVPERTEPPKRPDSRASGPPEDVGTAQPSPSTAPSGSQTSACASSREDNNLELAENAMQEEEEETEERERERRQEAGTKEGLREGAGVGPWDAEPSRDRSREDPGVREDEAGGAPALAAMCLPGRTEKPTEPPRCLINRGSDATESQSGPALEPGAAGKGCEQALAKPSPGPWEASVSAARRASLDPDPVWVSQLLRKLERTFMAHLAGAMTELRARWSLQGDSMLDQMVAELAQDVHQRLRDSVDKELRKVQSRAGRTAPGQLHAALRGQTSLQTELRRRRLQGLRNLSAVPEPRGLGLLSLSLEDQPAPGTILGARPGAEAAQDEFCPCDACVRKKVTPVCPKDPMGAPVAPIRKAFDLQQILQKKKGGHEGGEVAEVAPGKTETKLSQKVPWKAEIVQGATVGPELGSDLGPGVDKGGRWEGSPSPRRDAEQLEEEEALGQGSAQGDTLEAVGGQGDHGTHTVEALEAAEEGQPESEGSQGEKESGSQVRPGESQRGEASENSSLDRGERPPVSPTPGPPTAGCASSTPSLDSCSQVSQKGSEDGSRGGLRCMEAEAGEVSHAERRVTVMYPESSTSEQEDDPWGPRTTEQGAGEGCDVGDKGAAGTRADGFGQDDLDF